MRYWREVLPEGVMRGVDYKGMVADLPGQARRVRAVHQAKRRAAGAAAAGAHPMVRLARALGPVLVVALLTACGSSSRHGGGERSSADGGHGTATIFSPNGEPLSGGKLHHPDCEVAMDGWFERVDINHDGKIDQAEFLADARIQFSRMDLDHDGAITADELTTFRMPYSDGGRALAMPALGPAEPAAPVKDDGTGAHHRLDGQGRPSASSVRSRDGGTAVAADPVMAADANADFRVTLTEFLDYAALTFARLDSTHTGALHPEDVERACEDAQPRHRAGS